MLYFNTIPNGYTTERGSNGMAELVPDSSAPILAHLPATVPELAEYYVEIAKQQLLSNPEFLATVAKQVAMKEIVEDAHHELKISRISFDTELEAFLNQGCITAATKHNYRLWLNEYFKWCNSQGIDYLKVTRINAESYLVFLCNKLAPNSVRSMIMAPASFYNALLLRHPELMQRNPFNKLPLPKKSLARRKDTVIANDIKELIAELERIGRSDIICAVNIMAKYGFRVGFFENLKIDCNGNYTSWSKGTDMSGHFTMAELTMINDSGLLNLKKRTITNMVLKYTHKLHKAGIISCPFSPHDLRHYAITRDVNNCKNVAELIIS
jgi:integrase